MISKKLRLPISSFPKRGYFVFRHSFGTTKVIGNKLRYNRLGVIISSKVEPKSTKRHFLKRKVLDTLQKLPDLGKDILVIFSSSPPKSDVLVSINHIFNQIQNV